jgi:UPF0755 protein
MDSDSPKTIQDNYFYDQFRRKPRHRIGVWFLALLAIAILFYTFFFRPAVNFPINKVIEIKPGASLYSVSLMLEREGVVDSAFWFRLAVGFLGGDKRVLASSYLFKGKANVFLAAYRVVHAIRGFDPIKVVIPEGTSVSQMTEILKGQITGFDAKKFAKIAAVKEGYLFPDTYHLLPDVTPEQAIDAFSSNFYKKIEPLQTRIAAFGKPLADVINMASIIEEEGRTTNVRRMIAGILWKRLSIGMPLQVDAVFPFIKDKPGSAVTFDDLQIDSPYNTYIHKGLPPTPITNPGLDAILSAITPISSKYLYYLTDKNGGIHYATTHDEHLANKEKYLNN